MLMQTSEERRRLEKEIQKTRRHLSSLEARFYKVSAKANRSKEEQRLTALKQELKRENPTIKITPATLRLLKLVGTLPYSPLKQDKEDVAEAVARQYS